MIIYKEGINFVDAYVNKKAEYEIYGLPESVKKGDTIYCDVCCFKDSHTYIKGVVVRRYKHKTVLRYEYIDL